MSSVKSPRHLWSGDWRKDSERAREEAARQRELASARPEDAGPAREEAAPADAPPARERRVRPWLVALVAAAAAAVGATAAILAVGGGGSSDAPATLPAVSRAPVRPSGGQTAAGKIYNAASPAVVSIRTGAGSGTGFLVSRDGTLVTNAHVVGSAANVTVRFGAQGRSLDGRVMGTDPSSDLAVVRIDSANVPAAANPLQFADSRQVHVGDTAIAIGNPFGLDRTATEGIVSGLGREIQAPNGFQIDDVIQTDAPINPGNSGGPLLDDTGRVIGVNSQIATAGASGGNLGIGFAVPSNTVRVVVPRLERRERIAHPWLGVQTSAPLSGNGALVASTVGGGPAERAGVQPGDVITAVDGHAVAAPDDVSRAVNGKRPGDQVRLDVRRDGRHIALTATIGTRPAQVP